MSGKIDGNALIRKLKAYIKYDVGENHAYDSGYRNGYAKALMDAIDIVEELLEDSEEVDYEDDEW